ncbi:HEAT repeat domain-containing protein [Vulgatibacter sp.]|uniref:HEAT repeat domain-containing protein n=1 Tax=Vulgatibacter sp. TaxID=1971226 RepID=UPI0035617070
MLVLTIVVLEAAAMATLAAAFVLNATGRVPYEDLLLAAGAALSAIGGSVVVLTGYIIAFHVFATAREQRRQERVRGWSVWWRGLLQYTRRDVAGELPREAFDAFLDLREVLSSEENERLAVLADRYGIAEQLAGRLATKKQTRRLDALQDLARARLAPALPAIVAQLRDPEPLVRRHALRAAARTLARIPAAVRAAGVEAFVRALREVDLPPSLLAESMLLLEEAAAEVVAPILADPASHQPALQAALVAAGRRELRGLAEAVLPFVDHPEPEVRAAALRALAGMGRLPAGGEAAVVARVDDERPFVRVHAARAAALLPIESAGEVLWRRLGDSSWWVRLAAAESLGALGAAGRSDLERAALDHPDRFARDMAQQALADLRWKAA